jgi:hypothetical protein
VRNLSSLGFVSRVLHAVVACGVLDFALYSTVLTPVAHPLGGEASLLVCLYRDGLLQAIRHFKRSARLHNVSKTLLRNSSLYGRVIPEGVGTTCRYNSTAITFGIQHNHAMAG